MLPLLSHAGSFGAATQMLFAIAAVPFPPVYSATCARLAA